MYQAWTFTQDINYEKGALLTALEYSKMPSFETFRYLFAPKDENFDSNDVMEIKYPSMDALGDRFIARNSAENKYYVFAGMVEFEKYFATVHESQRCFHEVVLSKRPQKIKFDIDAGESLLNSCFDEAIKADSDFRQEIMEKYNLAGANVSSDTKMKIVLDEIDSAISNSFYVAFQKNICSEDIKTTDSTGKIGDGTIKFSFHKFIDKYYVESNVEAAHFVSEFFRKFLRPDFHDLIDFDVYKTTQNFRIVYNHKENSDRIKMPIGDKENVSMCSFLIQNVDGCEKLPKKSKKTIFGDKYGQYVGDGGISSQSLHPNDVKKVLRIASDYGLSISAEETHSKEGAAYTLNKINGGLITFHRLRPSECEVCKRRHDNENSLMLSVVTSGFGGTIDSETSSESSPEPTKYISRVYMLCRRNKTAKVFVGSFEPELSDEMVISTGIAEKPAEIKRKAQEKILDALVESHSEGTGEQLPPDQSKFSAMPQQHKTVYSSPQLLDFEYVDTLCVRAGMKMGKTKKLTEYVKKYFTDSDYYTNHIVLVSFRQTFSKEIQNKFPGFKLYNEISGEIDEARLIIQVESLHRIAVSPNSPKPDLLILDECESIFDQFDSGLHKKFSESWAVFKWLLANSKHLVCMDAGLSNRTYEILNRMRMGDHAKFRASSEITPHMHYHYNTYKNAVADTYYITVDKNEWYLDLYNSLAKGEKIAVPISSLAEARVLKENIERKFPKLRIGFYSSKTPMSEKRLHFSNVDEYWSCYDVLIYTPTVSAGISFERKHYHKIYAFFTDQSCHAEVCHQMIGRIRNVITGIHVVFIDSMRRNFPVTAAAVKNSLYDSRSSLFKEIGESPLQFEYQPGGKIKFYENDYFYMWLENTVVKNASRNNFMGRFMQIISTMGPTIKRLVVDASASDIEGIEMENAGAKSAIKESESAKIATAPEFSHADIATVQNKFMERYDKADGAENWQQDLTDEERFGYEKYRIRRDYQWGGAIDSKFVAEYNNSRNRRIFKNLVRIHCKDNIYDSLKQIQDEERINYEIAIDGEEHHQYGDIKRKYVFMEHWLAVEFLRICGISSLRDTSWKSQHDLKLAFREHEKKIYNEILRAHSAYGIKKPSIYTFTYSDTKSAREYVNGILEYINKVLLMMYGVKITASRTEPDVYNLKPNNLFDLSTKLDVGETAPDAQKQYPYKLPCINAKWRPVTDSGDVDAVIGGRYDSVDSGDINDLPDFLKYKLGL